MVIVKMALAVSSFTDAYRKNNKITEMLKSNAQTYLEKYISNEIDLDTLNIKLESSLVKLVYKQTFQKPKILVEINIKK